MPHAHIYAVKKIRDEQRAAPHLAVREIQGKSCPVSSVGFVPMPLHKQIGYAIYLFFFSAYMLATVTQKRIKATSTNRFFSFADHTLARLLPFQRPPVIVSFKRKMSDDRMKELAEQVDGSFTVEGRERVIIIRSTVTGEKLKTLMEADAEPFTNTRPGLTNINGIFAFNECLRLISAALSTHVYPAVIAPSEDGATPFYARYIQPHGELRQHKDSDSRFTKKARLAADDADLELEDEEMEDDNTDAREDSTTTHRFHEISAKPSPANFPFYGTSFEVPNLHGLCFPYFHGLNEPDFGVIPDVIATYLKFSIGSDDASFFDQFRELKKGIASWAMTDAGMALEHLFWGFSLAMGAQARLFVVMDDTSYNGFVLLGCDFTIHQTDRIIEVMTPEKLQIAVRGMSTNFALLEELVNFCNGLDPVEGSNAVLEAAGIKSARQIYDFVVHEKRTDDEEDTKIETLAMGINFPTPFNRINIDNICSCLFNYFNGGDVPTEAPMAVVKGFINYNRERVFMSQFGKAGFSLMQFKGKEWAIPTTAERDLASEPVVIGKAQNKAAKALSQILVSVKPFESCADDLLRLKNTWKIFQSGDLSGASKNIRFTGAQRDRLWDVLKDCHNVAAEEREAEIEIDRKKRNADRPQEPKKVLGKRKFDFDF